MSRSAWTLLALLSLTPIASAQAIYFTDELVSAERVPGCASDLPTWGSALAPGSDGHIYPSFANALLVCPSYVQFTAASTYVLEGAGEVRIHYGCVGPSNLLNVYVTLHVNGEEVSSASLRSGFPPLYVAEPITCTPGDVHELLIPIQTDFTLAPDDVLDVEFALEEVGPNPPYITDVDQGNARILVGAATPSGLYHPAFEPEPVSGPVVRHENLTGDVVDLDHSFAASNNGTFAYNWTGPANVTVEYDVEARSGSVEVQVLDGAGQTVVNATLEGANETLLWDGAAGTWTIRLAYDSFAGNSSIEITPRVATPPASGTQTSTSSTGSSTSTQTGGSSTTGTSSTQTGTQESPPMPLLWALGSLLALAAVLRRW